VGVVEGEVELVDEYEEEQVVTMNNLHSNHQVIHREEQLVVLVLHHSKEQVSQEVLALRLVLLMEVNFKHHHHPHLRQEQVVLMLQVMMQLQLLKLLVTQLKLMLLGLNMVLKYEVLVSLLILIHKSSVGQLQVVFKLIHKTLKYASFNHHPFHHQAHSSSKKCVHLNHLHSHHSVSNNKHHLFHNLLHLFFVNDHHNHQLHKVHKQLSENFLLYPYHHDRSSLNVFQLLHLVHVISSLNVGFLMELMLNERPLYNALKELKNIPNHVIL
jgi:hypothetical protein